MAERGGVREVQALLKVSRATVETVVNSEGFPDPLGILVHGLMWDMDDVREWAKEQWRIT
jgi:predicted DNA-binding transcriptional regulator AlpA